MARLERRLPAKAADSHFLQFARNVTSQGGEDGILEELFRLLGIQHGFCVDIGAWDGKHLSNTYTLLKDKGWGGLLFEANSDRYREMADLYADRADVRCECSLVDLQGDNSLTNLLDKHGVPENLEFLSIDIDGADYHLWQLVGKRYRAQVVCVEFNPTITNDVLFIQPPSTDVHQGASLLALIELGREMDYTVVVTTLFNAIFVRNDLMHLLPTIRNDIDTLHIPQMSTAMFQTYEGEIKLVGTKKLLWHKLAMNVNKMQVLAKRDQHFPFAPNLSAQPCLQAMQTSTYSLLRTVREDGVLHEALEEYVVAARAALRLPTLEGLTFDAMSKLIFELRECISEAEREVAWGVYRLLSEVGASVAQDQLHLGEKYLRAALSILRMLSHRATDSAVEDEMVVVIADLARVLRLQERVLEAWELLTNHSANRPGAIDARVQKELTKCAHILQSS